MSQADPNSELSQRVERLEMLLTHVDTLVAELNQVIVDQSKAIDGLQTRYERLSQRLIQVEESPKPQPLEDERPPHY